ncbi:MAG: hypothetical protein K9M60_03770, partial [Akkermansiaceae bacterium]|nr:hypothetical protein [Akkermansiaceae bacterium]
MIRRALTALLLACTQLVAQEPTPAADVVPLLEPLPSAEATTAIDNAPVAPAVPIEPPAESTPSCVSVLGYHDFSPTLPETEMRIRTEKFRWQMQALRDRGITV